MRRNFLLEIHDSDGDHQEYRVRASSAYAVARNAAKIARQYGHNWRDAIDLEIHELVEDADMSDAITLV